MPSTQSVGLLTAGLAIATLAVSSAEARVRIGFGIPLGAWAVHEAYDAQRRHEERAYMAWRRAKEAEAARLRRERAKARAAALARKKAAEKAATAQAANVRAEKSAGIPAGTSASSALTTSESTIKPAMTGIPPLKTASNADDDIKPKDSAPQSAVKLDCKRYFANVGLTISVPCED